MNRTSQIWSSIIGTLLIASAAEALPLLSEVYYDAVGSDDGAVFVEIAAAPGTVLDGWVVEGVNGSNGAVGPSVTITGTVDASGLFVIADRTSSGTTSVVGADLLANFDFQNGPDSVVLRQGTNVVDALGYGVFALGDFFAGEGGAAAKASAGSSLARFFANLDTNDNAVDFGVLAMPTPGSANFLPIPEPSSALLMAMGLSGLSLVKGRQGRTFRPTLRAARTLSGVSAEHDA